MNGDTAATSLIEAAHAKIYEDLPGKWSSYNSCLLDLEKYIFINI